MSKISIQVENQLASGSKICASATTHASKISIALAERCEAVQGQNNAATANVWETAMLAAGAQLESMNKALREAELKLAVERADDVGPKAQRDELHAALVALLVYIRASVELTLGAKGLKSYGLAGETPRNTPAATLSHAQNVVHQMEVSPVSMITDIGTAFETAPMVVALKGKAQPLETVLKKLDVEARELEDALVERNRVMEAWMSTYQGVANTLMGLYRLAGWVELAERVRPTVRVAEGDEVLEDLPAGGGEAAPAGG